MTNEEWVEELFHLAAEIGKYNDMHNKVEYHRKKHPNLSYTECAELSYVELKREHEEQYEQI